MKLTIRFGVMALALSLQAHALSQPDSRRPQLDEAEQLALGAKSLEREATRLQAGKDPTTATTLRAEAVDSMSLAVDIWERLHAPDLFSAGLTELSNLQMSSGEADASLATSHRLIDYWHGQANKEREGWAHFELATHVEAIRGRTESIPEWKQTIGFAKANGLDDVYANALSQEAILLKLVGRPDEAETAEREAKKAMTALTTASMRQPLVGPELTRLPEGWIDVPTSPLVAELKVVGGKSLLLLTNHDARSISSASLGCVIDSPGGWRLVRGLFGISIMDSTLATGGHFDITRDFASARDQWTDRPMGCQQGRPGVVGIGFSDGTTWHLPS